MFFVQHDIRAVQSQQMSVDVFLGIDTDVIYGDVNMTDHCLILA